MTTPPEDNEIPDSKEAVRKKLEEAKEDYKALGGWTGLWNGEWLLALIKKSFRNYWERANAEYFQKKYKSKDSHYIIKRLISVAARNASILGAVTGAAMSTNEIVALMTAGEGGIGIPANLALAATAIGGEIILLTRFQLQLVANIAKLYKVPLDPDDPEDILIIFGYAVGGAVAEEAGKLAAKVGAKGAGELVKKVIKKEVLEFVKQLGKKIGVKILQKTIVRYTVPLVSIGIGAGWNYLSMKSTAKIACKHFKSRCEENRYGRGYEAGNELGCNDITSGSQKRTPSQVGIEAETKAPAFAPATDDEYISGFKQGYIDSWDKPKTA